MPTIKFFLPLFILLSTLQSNKLHASIITFDIKATEEQFNLILTANDGTRTTSFVDNEIDIAFTTPIEFDFLRPALTDAELLNPPLPIFSWGNGFELTTPRPITPFSNDLFSRGNFSDTDIANAFFFISAVGDIEGPEPIESISFNYSIIRNFSSNDGITNTNGFFAYSLSIGFSLPNPASVAERTIFNAQNTNQAILDNQNLLNSSFRESFIFVEEITDIASGLTQTREEQRVFGGIRTGTFQVTQVPEPSMLGVLALGLFGLAARRIW